MVTIETMATYRMVISGEAQKQLNRVLGFTDFSCLQDSRLHGQRLYRVDDRRITPSHLV